MGCLPEKISGVPPAVCDWLADLYLHYVTQLICGSGYTMAYLSISLLGPLRVILGGEPVTSFESDKVRALLVFLAVESDRPHRREALVGLLWPEQTERSARHNLSQALFNLRRAIGDNDAAHTEGGGLPFLSVTHQTIQFNRSSDHSLDTTVFRALLDACEEHHHGQLETCDQCSGWLQDAVVLYQGDFFEGFSLVGSPAFEEWAVLQREWAQRLALKALELLARCHEQQGELKQALQHTRRQLGLDPWREKAHRQLMRLLALIGRRSAALRQYQECKRVLAEELDVPPSEETTALYQRIRSGKVGREEMGRDGST